MSFESGAVAFSLFHVPERLPRNAVERFAAHAAPPLKTLDVEEIRGWVGGRHLLDVPIGEENAVFAGYLRMAYLRAARKVPASLLRAHCLLEELALQRAEGLPFVKRQQRSQIRQAVLDRLLPEMPPQLKAIPFVHEPGSPWLLAQASGEVARDLFAVEFFKTTGVRIVPASAETLARERRRVDAGEWPRRSFSPEIPDEEFDAGPGRQFLTWLWFAAEEREGRADTADDGEFAFALDGPLVFFNEGDGAHETLVRRGAPTVSAEAKTCLLAGKTLRSARLMFARADQEWRATFDAERFHVRGLRLPEDRGAPRSWDAATRFQERMIAIGRFLDMLLALFDRFTDERNEPKVWAETVREIREWAARRKARH